MKKETARTTWAAIGGALYGFGAWCLPFIIASRQYADTTAPEFVREVLLGILCIHGIVVVAGAVALVIIGPWKEAE